MITTYFQVGSGAWYCSGTLSDPISSIKWEKTKLPDMSKMKKNNESTRPWKSMHHRVSGRDNYGQYYDLAAALVDGPKTLEQIEGHYQSYLRLIGIFTPLSPFKFEEEDWHQEILSALQVLKDWKWVEKHGETWELTEKGRVEAEKPIRDVRHSRKTIMNLIQPETVSKVSLGIHLFLAALKIPAALLSGSVGLLNDGVDTLLDALSSIFVYLGFKYDKERLVNVFLTLLMLIVASYTMKESILRLITPYTPEVDYFTFTATILSAILCGLLYFYQGYVGSKTGSMALITQSVDSRNHVIVAISVTAGLIGTITGFSKIDTFVGLGVALLILKSALELLVELIKNIGEEEPEVSEIKIPLEKSLNNFRRTQLRDYLLYMISKGKPDSLEDLKEIGRNALDFTNNPMLREMGITGPPTREDDIDIVLNELTSQGFIVEKPALSLTEKGHEQIRLRLKKGKHVFEW